MKIFTYKTFPAINMDNVRYFYVDEKYIRFVFSPNNYSLWLADSEDHANNLYNSIIDHLNDSSNHVHII